jgi:hypothetical protein
MRKAGHSGTHPVNCPNCLTAAQKLKMPWHASHYDVFAHATHGPALQRKHDAAIRRSLKSGNLKF